MPSRAPPDDGATSKGKTPVGKAVGTKFLIEGSSQRARRPLHVTFRLL